MKTNKNLTTEDNHSYLKRFKDFLRNKKVLISGIAAFSLMGTGCAAFSNLEARTNYNYERYNQYSQQGGELVELVCEKVQGDYDNNGNLDPLLIVTDGVYAGKKVKLDEPETFGNRSELRRARELINEGRTTIKVIGDVKESYSRLMIVDPKIITFSTEGENPGEMTIEDVVYTDIDENDRFWNDYTYQMDPFEWSYWTGPGGRFYPCNQARDWFWQDWDFDGIPNGLDRNPYGQYINHHAHWFWFNFHNHHHKNYFDHDRGPDHGRIGKPHIVISKDWLKQPGMIDVKKLTPDRNGKREISRSGDENRAIKKSDGSYDNNRVIRSNDGRIDRGAVKRSDGSSNDGSRAVKKDPPKTYQPVPRNKDGTVIKQKETEKATDSTAVKKKDDDNGRAAINSRYSSGNKDYSSSGSTATRSSTQFRYVPRNNENVVKREYKTPDFSSFRAKTPVYRNDSGARSSSGSSTRSYSAPVISRKSSSYSGSSSSRSYTPRSSSVRSSSSSSGTAVKKHKG